MPGLIGKKLGMSSIYAADGSLIPVTIIEAGPCSVVGIRTIEKNGYKALQLGFGFKERKKYTKPVLGQFKKNSVNPSALVKELETYRT